MSSDKIDIFVKSMLISMFTIFPFFFFSFFMVASNSVAISWDGFGVDSEGTLYLGTSAGIEVYQDGVHVNTIDQQTNRGYSFTVTQDDQILLSTGTQVYHSDTSGRVLDHYLNAGTDVDRQIAERIEHFTTSDGCVYEIKSPLGRNAIVRNGDEVIYQMPVLDYVAKLMLIYSALALTVTVFYVLYKVRD